MSFSQPSPRLSWRHSLVLASLTFGLFFGAGNLIFPITLGVQSGSAVWAAAAGFLVTAVGLPILGVIGSAMSGTSGLRELASRVGPRFAIVFTAALYLTIGPFFAIPRTATVSFEMAFGEALSGAGKQAALAAFTIVYFAVVLVAAMRPGKLMDYVGKFLTPVFLVLLGTLIVVAFVRLSGGSLPAPTETYAHSPGAVGALDGYNTMDALASLAFAVVLLEAVRGLGVTQPRRVAAELTRAGIIAAVGMGAIYSCLAVLGANAHGLVEREENGAVALAAIADYAFGPPGHILAALTMLAACVKTAIGLVAACVETFSDLAPGRLSARAWAIAFTAVSLVLANVGLDAIISAAVPVLQLLYPLAIVLIFLGLVDKVVRGRRLAHLLPMLGAGVVSVLSFLAALPERLAGIPGVAARVGEVLPGFEWGIGWLLPAAVGLLVGLVADRRKAAS